MKMYSVVQIIPVRLKMAENGLETILRKWSAPKLIPLNQIP